MAFIQYNNKTKTMIMDETTAMVTIILVIAIFGGGLFSLIINTAYSLIK
jgi:hypothetical protein